MLKPGARVIYEPGKEEYVVKHQCDPTSRYDYALIAKDGTGGILYTTADRITSVKFFVGDIAHYIGQVREFANTEWRVVKEVSAARGERAYEARDTRNPTKVFTFRESLLEHSDHTHMSTWASTPPTSTPTQALCSQHKPVDPGFSMGRIWCVKCDTDIELRDGQWRRK